MGYQESLEFLLNLSRKELQGLCKSHNLPANRSHVQLAKSLASFFKKKTVLATSSKEKSSSTVKCSFNISSLLKSKPKQKFYSQEEATRDHQLEAILGASERRNCSSESDSYRLISSIKEMVGDDSPHAQTGNQLEIINHHEIQILEKAHNAAMEVVSQYPVKVGATKGYGGSTSESGGAGTRRLDASDVQQHSTILQPGIGCHNDIKVNETQKASPPNASSQKMQDNTATKSGHNSFASTPCRECKIVEGSTKGYGGSTSESGGAGTRPLDASDVQQHSTILQPGIGCHNDIKVNETQKASPPKVSSQKMQDNAATKSGHNSFASTPCRECKIVEGSTESGFVSSDGILKKPAPSFQFFVMSEEGINLYVDLNSSLSEWINDMKDEVTISQKGYHHKSRTVSNHVKGLANADEHIKIPSVGIGMNLSIDGVERNTGSTNPYLSSAVSENCHSEACIPDPTAVTSSASVLIPSCNPVEFPGSFEGNQLVSASCTSYSGGQNQMAFDVASRPKERRALPQDLADAAFRMKKSNTSKLEASLKSINNVSLMIPEGVQYPDRKDCHSLKIATVDSRHAGVSCLDNTLITVSEKNSLPVARTNENKAESSVIIDIENNGSNCQVSMGQGITKGLSKVAHHQNSSPISCQLGWQLPLDCAATDALMDATLADHFPDQHASTSLLKDPVLALNDVSIKSIAAKEKDWFKHSEFHKASRKNPKRSYTKEFPEGFPSKKQQVNSEIMSGTMPSLRSTEVLTKEAISGPVLLPRRSTRLVPK